MLALKKLPLLVSYISVFVIVASSVRRTEVPAFLTYTLILAVLCGVGIIDEYRFRRTCSPPGRSKLLPAVRGGQGRCRRRSTARAALDRGPAPMAWRRSACWPWRCRSPSSASSLADPAAEVLYGLAIVVLLAAHVRDTAQDRADRAGRGHRDAGPTSAAASARARALRPRLGVMVGGRLAGRRP